jgi:hypothetical protein
VDTLMNDPTGLKYIATYGCKNDNATVIYVPEGPNNHLSGAAASTAVGNLPEYFLPGGDNTFQVKFNGQKLTWTVKTYNVYQYTATAQDASSASARCKKANSTTLVRSVSPESTGATAVVSPNPTSGRFIIAIHKGIISGKDVHITDVTGKTYIPKIIRSSLGMLEVELPAGASGGVYFVSVKVDNEYKIFKVVKL